MIGTRATFLPTDFGAVPDGESPCTQSIQAAVDACSRAGGGYVRFTAGTFLTGTIFLQSNVFLLFDPGARIHGSIDLADYPRVVAPVETYTNNYTERSLFVGMRARNIGLIGPGVISGRGDEFAPDHDFHGRTDFEPYKVRPFIIRMIECEDVIIRDVTLIKPAMWAQHYLLCSNLVIDSVRVDSWESNVNNDGIDIDSCSCVRIVNCVVRAEDDAIVLKSTTNHPCRDIQVSNCHVESLCNGIKLGTESMGGFENIVIANCTIANTRSSGIALESVDGGFMRNIVVNGITMRDVNNPIFIRHGARGRPVNIGDAKRPVGSSSDISIANVVATGVGNFTSARFSNLYMRQKREVAPTTIGCMISGLRSSPLASLLLHNIRIDFAGGGHNLPSGIQVPELEDGYPEFCAFGELPGYGFYVRHVKNLTICGMQLSWRRADERPAIVLDDVQGANITNVQASSPDGLEVVRCQGNCHAIFVAQSQALDPRQVPGMA